jgi:hypothetical protein
MGIKVTNCGEEHTGTRVQLHGEHRWPALIVE